MSFYDIHYGGLSDRNVRMRNDSLPSGTSSNWDQVDAAQSAAVAKAALLAKTLPSNQPNKDQGTNWVQGLANTFDPTSAEHSPETIAPDRLIRNPNFNMLYQVDPKKANMVYRKLHPDGKSFDEALKEQQDQKTFVRKTVQERIASNQLRQGITGDWEELMDTPADPNDITGRGGKKWVPASYQTLDFIKKAGGPEGVGMSSYANLPLPEMAKALTGAGIVGADAQKAWLAQNGMVKPTTQATTTAPVLNQSNQVEGLVSPLLRGIARGADIHQSNRGYDPSHDTLRALPSMIGPSVSNLLARLFGGTIQDINPDIQSPAPTQDQLNTLRALVGRH